MFRDISPDELVQRALSVAILTRSTKVDANAQLNCRELLLNGDETQLSQLLLNLVINGFHAMEGEGGMLSIRTFVQDGRVACR